MNSSTSFFKRNLILLSWNLCHPWLSVHHPWKAWRRDSMRERAKKRSQHNQQKKVKAGNNCSAERCNYIGPLLFQSPLLKTAVSGQASTPCITEPIFWCGPLLYCFRGVGSASVSPALSWVPMNRTGKPFTDSFLCFVVPLVQCLSCVQIN